MLDDMTNELDEAKVEYFVRWAERRFFKDVPPVAGVEIRADLEGPACFVPGANKIYVHAAAAQFPKWCGVLLLHELIHTKLHRENGDPDAAEGPRFQAEIERLWAEGAYKGRL